MIYLYVKIENNGLSIYSRVVQFEDGIQRKYTKCIIKCIIDRLVLSDTKVFINFQRGKVDHVFLKEKHFESNGCKEQVQKYQIDDNSNFARELLSSGF